MKITRLVLATLVVAISAQAAEPRTVALGPTSRDAQGREGRVHTVVVGDTLWDISEAYLGNPLIWPTVWKSNPGVKNPHWIYPGEQIWISGTEMRPITRQESESLTVVHSTAGEDATVRTVGSFPVPDMEDIGFVSAAQFETAGALLGSPEQEKWLGAHRRAWVSFGESEVQVGDRFTVVREAERVRDPETGKKIGVHVEKLGWLEITKVGPDSSDAMIRVSSAEMQRGDRLIPRIEPALEVPVRVGVTAPVEGQIALLPNERTITAQRDVIFLNRGIDDGIEIGSALEVYRPGDVVKDRETKAKHAMPDEVIANLIVISAEPNSAIAIATHATVELARGDHFRTAPDMATSYRESSLPIEGTHWTARTIEGRNEGLPTVPAKAAPAGKP